MQFILLQSTITSTAPSFHNPGLIRMWNESPLREFNPHVLLVVLTVILLAWLYYYFFVIVKKARLEEEMLVNSEKKVYEQLLVRQSALLKKIIELEENRDSGVVNAEEFAKKYETYKQHLIQVKLELKQFTE